MGRLCRGCCGRKLYRNRNRDPDRLGAEVLFVAEVEGRVREPAAGWRRLRTLMSELEYGQNGPSEIKKRMV